MDLSCSGGVVLSDTALARSTFERPPNNRLPANMAYGISTHAAQVMRGLDATPPAAQACDPRTDATLRPLATDRHRRRRFAFARIGGAQLRPVPVKERPHRAGLLVARERRAGSTHRSKPAWNGNVARSATTVSAGHDQIDDARGRDIGRDGQEDYTRDELGREVVPRWAQRLAGAAGRHGAALLRVLSSRTAGVASGAAG
jgi:hypothetical protein